MRYDVIVIGTGPAGLSAAITLKIRNKNVLVLGNREVSQKVSKAHEINNYLGIPQASGEELSTAFLNHAKSLGVDFEMKQVSAVYAMGDYFSLQTTDNENLEASSVILATGVNFGKPYPGEEEFLGRGVSYCATCDAPLYRDKKIIIIGASKKEEHEANFMSEICREVIYIPTYKDLVEIDPKVTVIHDKPLKINGNFKAEKLILQNREIEADGIFILRDSISPKQLVPGLEMEENHIRVDRKMKTNIKGCFACGDIVGIPYQYIKAAGEGNIAALSAVEYLSERRKSDGKED